MLKVYVAGPMSSENCIKYLDNIRKGIQVSKDVLLHGHACFSPFIDFTLFLALKDGETIDLKTIQDNSMAWLEVSDVVLVLPGYQKSKGTEREIRRAGEKNIPVIFYCKEFDWKQLTNNKAVTK